MDIDDNRRFIVRQVTADELLSMRNSPEVLFEITEVEQASIRGGYCVRPEHKGDFCKMMMTMMDEGWFGMCSGAGIRNKEKFVIEVGRYLNVDLSNYYVNMSKSFYSSEETFLNPFRVLLERAKKIWNKKNG